MQGNREGLDPGTRGSQTGREPRHLTGHRQVSFQVGGRDREHVREIVETAVRGFIPRQQRLDIDLEREQVTNGIVVFGTVETLDGVDPARIAR